MKAKGIAWQSEPDAEIRSFKGSKYYVELFTSRNTSTIYIVMSEKEKTKEEIKVAAKLQYCFDFNYEPEEITRAVIRNVTNCKKYN